jgi:hypothetical protein
MKFSSTATKSVGILETKVADAATKIQSAMVAAIAVSLAVSRLQNYATISTPPIYIVAKTCEDDCQLIATT